MKIIKGDLILKEDTTFNENIRVVGNIKGNYNLNVKGNIDCWNIDCWNLVCYNLDCYNLVCYNLDCEEISYFSVCYARKSFKCKSIKGKRKNHKHFCLDKEIEYRNKTKICDKCGKEVVE